MSSELVQLVVLAGVLIFLVLRIGSVLGTRTGFEPDETATAEPAARRRFDVIDGTPDQDIIDFADPDSAIGKALAAMKRIEPSFSVGDFMRGARQAHEMILMAYENGNLDPVRGFLAPEVLHSFDQAIMDRADKGLTVKANFIGLRETTLRSAQLDPTSREAELTVHFVSELTSMVKDLDGNVVEGDDTTIRREASNWTFGRVMGSDDPNWQLVATVE